jgi:hypothetical protein
MKLSMFVASAVVTLTMANLASGQDAILQDQGLSNQQKKYLKQLQRDLENRPINPTASDQYVAKVQGSLKQLFAVNNRPSGECSDILATTLYNGLNNGQISVEVSVLLSKELSKALGAKEVNYQTVNQFTRTIDPLVQRTTLSPTEKLKLYRDALIILKTVPNYVPESR